MKIPIPQIGDEIWLPGGKRRVEEIRRRIETVVETNLSDNQEIKNHTKISHSVLVQAPWNDSYSGWFEWENSISGQQEYFEEHFKRRDCRKCQFPLPGDKCEVHG